jgi:hypothetical protein
LADFFEFEPVRLPVLVLVVTIVPLYVLAAEVAKKVFYAGAKS